MSQNLTEIVAHFGRIPSFHDSELKAMDFDVNQQILKLTFDAFTYSDISDSRGYLFRQNECIVKFIFYNVLSMKFDDFAEKNIVANIEFENVGSLEKFIQSAAYGVCIEVLAKEIVATVIT